MTPCCLVAPVSAATPAGALATAATAVAATAVAAVARICSPTGPLSFSSALGMHGLGPRLFSCARARLFSVWQLYLK